MTSKRIIGLVILFIGLMASRCGRDTGVRLQKELWGKSDSGEPIYRYTLTSAAGTEVCLTNYGGYITNIRIPGRDGNIEDVVLGYQTLKEYLNDSQYLGCVVGRYANRIAKARFTLNGKEYQLAANNGENHLHGGIKGLNKVVWQGVTFQDSDQAGVKLSYLSPDGEEGYPGKLMIWVTITLNKEGNLRVDFSAESDQPTPVNLTHHGYFNLNGGTADILGHVLKINADYFLPVDKGLIPTGEMRPVAGTPFDFTKPHSIGSRINDDNEQLRFGMGYDHNFVLRNQDGDLALAATVYDPKSGRTLEIYTTEPGLQFYSGNFLDGSTTGKYSRVYRHRYALALEPQHYPDSPNQPKFPSVILQPGQKYRHTTLYRFGVRGAEPSQTVR